jgi:hypothetical protein
MKKKVYYAHSMALYGSKIETRDIVLLEDLDLEVINPSSNKVLTEFAEWKEHVIDLDGQLINEMDFFTDQVTKCDVLAFRAHTDGNIGSGVFAEIKAAQMAGLLIIELPTRITQRSLTIEQTREYLRESGNR